MVVDTKDVIAQAVYKLIFEKKVRMLTVNDIVEECNITRQAFYYHFSDIPDLLQWMLRQGGNEILSQCQEMESIEEQIKLFMSIAINATPVIKKGMSSNYSSDLARLLFENMKEILTHLISEKELFSDYSPGERELIIKYHF